jgi:ribosomal protein S18 acetylase RimI-like enzyme
MKSRRDDDATFRKVFVAGGLLILKPIDFESHSDDCVRFRADSFVCSVGSAQAFLGEDNKGGDRYLVWLRGKSEALPGSCAHLWDGSRLVGQMEVGLQDQSPVSGYIYLVYLIPEYRGRGVGGPLLTQAEALLAGYGAVGARLRVSPSNPRALKLYEKNGWCRMSEQPDAEGLLVMHKRL